MRELHAAPPVQRLVARSTLTGGRTQSVGGVGLVRGGARTARSAVTAKSPIAIGAYAALGIDEFVLSGYPHLEELYWFGEGVIPNCAWLFVRRRLAATPTTRGSRAPPGPPFLPPTPAAPTA